MLPTAVEEADTLPLVGDESDRQFSAAIDIINVCNQYINHNTKADSTITDDTKIIIIRTVESSITERL